MRKQLQAEPVDLVQFYRELTYERLKIQRGSLRAELRETRRRPTKAKHTEGYCLARLKLIEQVMREKGIVE